MNELQLIIINDAQSYFVKCLGLDCIGFETLNRLTVKLLLKSRNILQNNIFLKYVFDTTSWRIF